MAIALVAIERRGEVANVNRYLHDDEGMFPWAFGCEDKHREDATGERWRKFMTHFAY